MDPIALIVAALAAGAAAGIGDVASKGISDAYAGLKALVTRRFASNARAEAILAEHEADPDTYEKPLAKQLQATHADEDPDIVQAARQLLALMESAGMQPKYHVQVTGGKVGNIGDHGHVGNIN